MSGRSDPPGDKGLRSPPADPGSDGPLSPQLADALSRAGEAGALHRKAQDTELREREARQVCIDRIRQLTAELNSYLQLRDWRNCGYANAPDPQAHVGPIHAQIDLLIEALRACPEARGLWDQVNPDRLFESIHEVIRPDRVGVQDRYQLNEVVQAEHQAAFDFARTLVGVMFEGEWSACAVDVMLSRPELYWAPRYLIEILRSLRHNLQCMDRHYSVEEATIPPDPTSPRVRCDKATHTVTLDGKVIARDVDPVPFTFFAAVADGGGDPVPGRKILSLPAMSGKKLTRDALDKLPETLRNLVKSRVGGGGGYYLDLPQ